jgi:hypothetical protein
MFEFKKGTLRIFGLTIVDYVSLMGVCLMAWVFVVLVSVF